MKTSFLSRDNHDIHQESALSIDDSESSEIENAHSTSNEESFEGSSSADRSNNKYNQNESNDNQLAKKESLLVNRSKIFMYLVLLTTATVASIGTYFFASQGEQDDFEREFDNTANELLKGAEQNAKQIFGSVIKLGESITSFALGDGSKWPNVTLPNFDVRITEPFEDTHNGAQMVLFAPKVKQEDRYAFEEYAVQNQGWISDDLRNKGLQYARPGRIPERIHTISTDDAALPFAAPLWQIGPVPSVSDPILADLYTHPSFRRMIDDVEIDRKLLVSYARCCNTFLFTEISLIHNVYFYHSYRRSQAMIHLLSAFIIPAVLRVTKTVQVVLLFSLSLTSLAERRIFRLWDIFLPRFLGRPISLVSCQKESMALSLKLKTPVARRFASKSMGPKSPTFRKVALIIGVSITT